jgi:hypothetical protein
MPKFKDTEFDFPFDWVNAMTPIATAVDFFQGEQNIEAYFGAILPTIFCLFNQLFTDNFKSCTPLAKALKKGLETRFANLVSIESAFAEAKEFVIASVCHLYFGLPWIPDAYKQQAQELFFKELETISKASIAKSLKTSTSIVPLLTNEDINLADTEISQIPFMDLAHPHHN